MNALTLLSILSLALPASAEAPRGALHCTATYRGLNERNESFEKSAPLLLALSTADFQRYSGRLAERALHVTEQRQSGDLFAQILNARTGTQGSTARGATDSFGHFSTAEVAGASVYRIDCQRR